MAEQIRLQSWLETLDSELALETETSGSVLDEDTMHIILDLARDAANNVTRPASPLTVFTLGVLVGRGTTLGQAAAHLTQIMHDAAPEGSGAEGSGDTEGQDASIEQ